MNSLARLLSGLAATTACFLTVSASAFAITHKPVVASANDFMSNLASNRKTESVAANQQRSFAVSSGKAAAVFNKAASVVLTDFPVSSFSNGVVELDRSRPIIDGETVFMKNGKPVDDSFTPVSVQTFRGVIRGEEHSKVILSIVDGNMIGAVEHENGERYLFSPLSDSKQDAREHTLFAESGVLGAETRSFSCMTPDDVHNDTDHDLRTDGKGKSLERTLSNDLLEFDLAIDTDYKLFQRFGGDDQKMQAYVYSLIAMVSSIYEDEINVTYKIGYFGFWSEPDPYEAGGDISEILKKFAAYWRSNNANLKRNIAHLITGPGTTNVGGIAYPDQLCNKYMGYSVSGIEASYTFPTTSYTWDVNVVAHEIGHNFRSPHTHVCNYWGVHPLDTCVTLDKKSVAYAEDACFKTPPVKAQGSIMSYCHLLTGKVNLTFTPPVIQVIRAGAEDAICLTKPTEPVVLLQNPLGNQVFSEGADVDIRWTSARVDMVGIEYSSDNGAHWTSIVDAVPATTRKYVWKIPNVASSEMLVRIYSVGNRDVNDMSIVVFEVRAPMLTISYPLGGERFAQKSAVTVKWTQVLVPSVAIDFSSDNGAHWETVVTGLTAKEYKWEVPQIVTSEAVIRVRDESNDEIISQSQVFAIGVPVIQITAPAAGVHWSVNKQYDIRWTSDFVDKVRIEYKVPSKDWVRVGPIAPLAASLGSYTWTVPNDLTEDAVIRVRSAVTEEPAPADTSDPFMITVVGVNEPNVASEAFSIVPQPANDHVSINFSLINPINHVRIAVQDVTGRTVAEVFPEQRGIGNYSVELSTAALAQGVYFVTIEAGSTTLTRPLTILH